MVNLFYIDPEVNLNKLGETTLDMNLPEIKSKQASVRSSQNQTEIKKQASVRSSQNHS